ncbi:MAG TPA: hypothetical protein VJ975_12730, partial [Candidatus Limnocylindria bacterium]|nr:hypothetical protein [Candidatus Limnocylindria bacterium]
MLVELHAQILDRQAGRQRVDGDLQHEGGSPITVVSGTQLRQQRWGLRQATGVIECVCEIRDEPATSRSVVEQIASSGQEADGRERIAPTGSRSTGTRQSLGRRAREPVTYCRVVADFRLVASRLLVVIADDLVLLEQFPVLIQPLREALMQLCAHRLGQRLVRRVANQEVPEAEGVVPRNLRTVGTHQLLAHERQQVGWNLRAHRLRRESGHRAAVEDLALDGAALDDRALVIVERIEPGLQHGVDGGWHAQLARRLARQGGHLLQEERVAVGHLDDALPSRIGQGQAREQRVGQAGGIGLGQWFEEDGGRIRLAAAPSGAHVDQLGAADAQDEYRRVAHPVDDVLDEVEQWRLGPLQIIEDQHQWTFFGDPFEPGARRQLRVRRGSQDDIVGIDAQLHQHLDEGPVGDPFAIRQSAAARHPGVLHALQEVGDQPRFADP